MNSISRDILITGAVLFGTVYLAPPMIIVVYPAVVVLHLIRSLWRGASSIVALCFTLSIIPASHVLSGVFGIQTLVFLALLALLAVGSMYLEREFKYRRSTEIGDHLDSVTAAHIKQLDRQRHR